MTHEDAIQAALDKDPDDVWSRNALLDLLQETGDERYEGYRALTNIGARPCMRGGCAGYHNGTGKTTYGIVEVEADREYFSRRLSGVRAADIEMNDAKREVTLPSLTVHSIPTRWFDACWLEDPNFPHGSWVLSDKRRTLDDIVALAFIRLPLQYREHMMTSPNPRLRFSQKCSRCGDEPDALCTQCYGVGFVGERPPKYIVELC